MLTTKFRREGVRVVVCTYQVSRDFPLTNYVYWAYGLATQILLDTLIHGFIRMPNLALIVFDEGRFYLHICVFSLTLEKAHHCTASNPANRIMRDFYHQTEITKRPQILGLTASPQTRGKTGELE